MKRVFLILLVLIVVSNLSAQTVDWVKQVGGTSSDEAKSIAVDAAGNIYTTGYFSGTVDFDPGEGVTNLTAIPQTQDIFIQKLDASGNFIWARHFSNSNIMGLRSRGLAIAVDDQEKIYITGYFRGTVDFDPGIGVVNIISQEYDNNAFVLKLDAEGHFEWVKQIGGKKAEGHSIAVDQEGNVYTTGIFEGTVDFDPGDNTLNFTYSSFTAYIQKLDAAGNLLWARAFAEYSIGSSIAVDAAQNAYVTGYFVGGPSKGNADAYVLKWDVEGNLVWLKQMGGIGGDYGRSLALDGSGNIFITGNFEQTADFNIGSTPSNITSRGHSDIFVAKVNSSGELLWVKHVGGSGYDQVTGLSLDGEGNVYTTGSFSETVDFDPNIGVYNLSVTQGNSIFIQKLTSSGAFSWARQLTVIPNSITTNNLGNIFLTGYFLMSTDLDPETDQAKLFSNNSMEIFILKLKPTPFTEPDPEPEPEIITDPEQEPASPVVLQVDKDLEKTNIKVYPNPFSDYLQVELPKSVISVLVHICDQNGRVVRKQVLNNGGLINLEGLTKGLYLLKIQYKDQETVFKQIKI